MARPPSTEERDANLDALKKALDDMSNKEIERLDKEAKFMRSVLKGRGFEKTGVTNLEKAMTLVQRSINEFSTTYVKSTR